MNLLFFIWMLIANCMYTDTGSEHNSIPDKPLLVRKCDDFDLTGKGDQPAWFTTGWHYLKKLDPQGEAYETKFKILYSAKGIYVLFSGKDMLVSTQYDQDFGDLFKGDVFEVFFHPNPEQPLYFEYEINQLGKELVLLIPNFDGSLYGWKPWHYEGNRVVKKKVMVTGGKAEPKAVIQSWTAELFFPFALLRPLQNVPPVSGTVWNANFYRLDYDSGSMVKWAWSPVSRTFHEYQNFRPIKFE